MTIETPFPKGWKHTCLPVRGGRKWFICTANGPDWVNHNWPERSKHEARGEASTPDEARRLCREEAERKSRAEHKGDSNADNQV